MRSIEIIPHCDLCPLTLLMLVDDQLNGNVVAVVCQALESRYSGLEQALLLAWCTHVKKGTSRDELQAWQMAPYVEAVLSQPRSHFLIQVRSRFSGRRASLQNGSPSVHDKRHRDIFYIQCDILTGPIAAAFAGLCHAP